MFFTKHYSYINDFNNKSLSKESKERYKKFVKENKQYEIFAGKQSFKHARSYFEFEKFLYPDKISLYQDVKYRNKKFIPELISYYLTECIRGKQLRTEDLFRNIEKYFQQILRNLDYIHHSYLGEVIQTNNIFETFGTNVGHKYNNNEWHILLMSNLPYPGEMNLLVGHEETKKQIQNRIKFLDDTISMLEHHNFKFCDKYHSKLRLPSEVIQYSADLEFSRRDRYTISDKHMITTTEKTTKDLIEHALNEFNNQEHSISLLVVCSCSQIVKTCYELEKYIVTNNISNIEKVLIVSDKSPLQILTPTSEYDYFELKFFLFEILLHLTDKNNEGVYYASN